jgi:hypothetical protein
MPSCALATNYSRHMKRGPVRREIVAYLAGHGVGVAHQPWGEGVVEGSWHRQQVRTAAFRSGGQTYEVDRESSYSMAGSVSS